MSLPYAQRNISRARRRRARHRLENFVFKPWHGYFQFDPNNKYDSTHLCPIWQRCCWENLKLKPSHLIESEKKKGSRAHKIRLNILQKQLDNARDILKQNISNYSTSHDLEKLIEILKTYTWLCNELLKIKF